MEDLLECVFSIGVLIVSVLIIWALLSDSNNMHSWTEDDWIENYEGDVDDPIWH